MKPISSARILFILKPLAIIGLMLTVTFNIKAQGEEAVFDYSILNQRETELEVLMLSISTTQGERRMELNKEFQLKLGQALKLENAHLYPFQKLVSVSQLTSSDLKIRVFTWELDDSEGNIQYFGFVSSHRTNESPVVFTLNDKSASLEGSEYTKGTAHEWYGALYYELRTVESKKATYYVVLGINRRKSLIKERIVDAIYVDDEVYFGKEVFNTGNRILKKRLVYQHSSETDMTLTFENEEVIVVDHLIPSSPAYEGKREYYVPDLSYDAFELKKGIWNYTEDYDAKLDKNIKDRFYEMELPSQKKIY
jgi:hypothetical protein